MSLDPLEIVIPSGSEQIEFNARPIFLPIIAVFTPPVHPDVTAPELVSALGVNRRRIRLTFNEAMGSAGLTTLANYTVAEQGGADPATLVLVQPVPVGFGPLEVDLYFSTDLTAGTDTYLITVGPGVTDLAGNAINPDEDQAFATIPDLADVEIPDHCQRALDRRAARFSQDPNLSDLICALVDQLQDLEQAFADLDQGTGIDTATGARLDAIGTLIGLGREGLDDASYRVRLRGKALARGSRGTPEDMLAILRLLVDGASPITFEDHYLAAFVLTADDGIPNEAGYAFARIIRFAKPAGVRPVLLHTDTSEAPIFGWDEDAGAGVWGETSPDPAGGYWAEAS